MNDSRKSLLNTHYIKFKFPISDGTIWLIKGQARDVLKAANIPISQTNWITDTSAGESSWYIACTDEQLVHLSLLANISIVEQNIKPRGLNYY